MVSLTSLALPVVVLLSPLCPASQGNITVELYWNHAPKSCQNFVELVGSEGKFHAAVLFYPQIDPG